MERRLLGGLLVLAAALAVGLGSRRMAKPRAETAPAHRVKGAADARVTIVEFSDFQCPACRYAEAPLRKMLELYGKDSRFIFKNFPLERIHEHARATAVAAECAGRQGKFWELHDMLYDKQSEWAGEHEVAPPQKVAASLTAYGKALKLDLKAFEACRADPQTQKVIDADVEEARQRWVGSTPTFFINGRRFVGAKQLQERGTRWIEKTLK